MSQAEVILTAKICYVCIILSSVTMPLTLTALLELIGLVNHIRRGVNHKEK